MGKIKGWEIENRISLNYTTCEGLIQRENCKKKRKQRKYTSPVIQRFTIQSGRYFIYFLFYFFISGQSRGNGLYWIDPNGGSTDDSFQAFCDMETERGGWTLVATKVSPSFSFIKSAFSTVAAKTKHSNAASRIHPSMGDWKEVMFRFADVKTIRVIYNRKAGAPNTNKKEFQKFLMGKSLRLVKNVFGFYKYSPADRKRSPTGGFASINRLFFYSNHGISEEHRRSDKWLDMWNGADGSNNYIYSDDSRARGTKCIAGYCYLNKPIWVMVR